MSQDTLEAQAEIINMLTGARLPAGAPFSIFREKLAAYINELINTNFEKLVALLYRIDVSETKLRSLLATSSTDAGIVIADIIIERQLQKISSRQYFSSHHNSNDIPEEDKW